MPYDYLLPVRAIRVEPRFKNLQHIETFTSKGGFNGVSYYGQATYEQGCSGLYVETKMGSVKVNPGDWIVEVFDLDYRVFTNAEFYETFRSYNYYKD